MASPNKNKEKMMALQGLTCEFDILCRPQVWTLKNEGFKGYYILKFGSNDRLVVRQKERFERF